MASSAFTPALSKAPSDWTMFINYTGAGMSSPTGVGVDGNGNVWVASYFSAGSQSSGAVSEFSPTGNAVFTNGITSGGIFHSYGLAVDAQNNVWVPNEDSTGTGVNGGLGSVTTLSSTGQVTSGAAGYYAGGIYYPIALAVDTNATTWVINYGNSSLTLLSSSGQPLSGAKGYASPKLVFPVAIALDSSHNAWLANQEDVTVTKVSADGSQFTSYSCCNGASGIAIDQRGDVWVANYYGDSISQLGSDGTVISSGYSDNKASIWHPHGIAIDGSGHVWVANYLGSSITELAGSAASSPGQILSPTAGYTRDAGFVEAYAVAIDASGNLWITNFYTNTLTEIIGLATPVKTPQIGPVQAP
jgi:streptogramin lyase